MVRGSIAPHAASAKASAMGCPFHGKSADVFQDWLDSGLRCSAGKREFKLGRYLVAPFRTGADFAASIDRFRQEIAAHKKTGFLGLFVHDEARCANAEDELWLLGTVLRDAGLTDDVRSLIAGGTVRIPIDVACPVTGEQTTFEFFSVAFCRYANDPGDKLYDPSLSAPFTAINTTSDAFAFAMLVHDQAMRAWGKPPHQMEDRDAVELLFRKCTTAWQNMSINTIRNYEKVSIDPARAVHLSPDSGIWTAPHNDPVFGELEKKTHAHEMPVVYASRLCTKWLATLFEGKAYTPGRDGQSGGVETLSIEGLPTEMYDFSMA